METRNSDTAAGGRTLTQLQALIAEAEAVSFDIFDTLFVRLLREPEDVFDLLGHRFGIANFRALRQQAQQRAFQRMQEAGDEEITLDGIYACLESTAVPASKLRDAEFEIELAVTVPNPRLIEIFNAALAEKPVVVTSDMYLPRSFFDELFRRHGLRPSAVFVSSERNATKRDRGALFDIVARELGIAPARILHIGDNALSDIARAQERGFSTFHFVDTVVASKVDGAASLASLGCGLPRAIADGPSAGTFAELGFRYGGPGAVGFLDWIAKQARDDRIDHVLFVSRDGYVLERIARELDGYALPAFSYFKGSRVAFAMAAATESNFDELTEFFVAGAHGLRPIEVLERIGVAPPANEVMDDIGLGSDVVVDDRNLDKVRGLLRACRADILRVCRRNRRGLFRYLVELGIRPGMRVAVVDVGWNGTAQEMLSLALKGLIDVELYGYYFCLNDSEQTRARERTMRMSALLSRDSLDPARLAKIYANRVVVELFFSAPHDAVIGYEPDVAGGVRAVEDPGRVPMVDQRNISRQIVDGILLFAERFKATKGLLALRDDPLDVAAPLIHYVEHVDDASRALFARIENFDAWASTRNHRMALAAYLTE
ncbi:hydrolase [Burkholderia multivorans]|uniref:HAD family hydrolase n=1 Tax=Burkholderia multivorans TaxID=87883 RepID=UPI0006C7CD89|nr:hydrolase [Burkholderia multivorans]KPJ33623.1 hydrolase [Burkholderia multivorans]KVT41563.1 hydrolase [Burkholderia multivorans]KVV32784.1 hydrolase [Burkholderia multivorans]MCA8386202.1 hydrolase [Burkholderia multivorans]MDN7846468.1 hydrolase [Burkholderia multivorans]